MIALRAALIGLLLPAAGLAAQDTTQAADTRADTAVATAVPGRSTPLPPEVPAGPLPAGARWVFTRDSLVWSTAWTVADLLAEVPGVFAARSGFVQSATALGIAGRGTDGVEVFWDGVPWQPVGPDSLGPDLAAISLFTLRRVEVHQLPGLLRVYLASERWTEPGSRSVIRIVSGAQHAGGYAGLFQEGWASGLRLNLAADGLRTDRPTGEDGADRRFDVWGRLDWTPTPRVAAGWQIRRSDLERDARTAGPITVGARAGKRTDALLTLRLSSQPGGLGWSVGSALRSSGFSDSVFGERVMREVAVDAAHRGPRDALRLRAAVGDGAVRRRLDAEAGAAPLGFLIAHGGATWVRDAFDRDSWRTWGTLGLMLGPFTLSGDAVRTRGVAALVLATDTVQRATDLGLRLAFAGRRLAARLAVERRDAWAATPVGVLDELPLAPAARADWAVAWIRLGPVRSFSLSGTYADARGAGSPDLQPPTHGRIQLTYRNKFWPTFRSGVFDLKVQWAVESWSTGTIGREPGGTAIALPGATFQEWFLQFEIAGFRAFYSLRNARNSRAGYLPDVPQPRNAQTFGVKWEFSS